VSALFDDSPTLAEMRTYRDSLNATWGYPDGGVSTAIGWAERLYLQDFTTPQWEGQYRVKTGSAPSDADSASDELTPPDDLRVTCRPQARTEAARKQAERLVRAGKGFLNSWRDKRDPYCVVAQDMTLTGVGVSRVLFDPARWPDAHDAATNPYDLTPAERWEYRKRQRVPIVLERRNPRHCRFLLDDDGDVEVMVEDYWTRALDAKRLWWQRYPQTVRSVLTGKQPDDLVNVSDIWVGRHRCLLLDDRPVFPIGKAGNRGVVEHGYPTVPYQVACYREASFDDVVQMYRGFFAGVGDLYPLESTVLNMYITMLAWNSWRTYYGHTVDERPIIIRPGDFIELDERKNEYIRLLQGEPAPPEVLQMIPAVQSLLSRNGLALGGAVTEGARSAQQVWANQSMRTAKIERARKNLATLVEKTINMALIIVEEVIGQGVRLPNPGHDERGRELGALTIRPEDIQGYYELAVSFGRRLDPSQLEQAKALAGLWQIGWLPRSVSYELSGMTDTPQDWVDLGLKEAVDRLPWTIEMAGYEQTAGWYGDTDWRTTMYRSRMQVDQGPTGPAAGAAQAAGPPGGPQVPSGTAHGPGPEGPAPNTFGQGLQSRPQGAPTRMAPVTTPPMGG